MLSSPRYPDQLWVTSKNFLLSKTTRPSLGYIEVFSLPRTSRPTVGSIEKFCLSQNVHTRCGFCWASCWVIPWPLSPGVSGRGITPFLLLSRLSMIWIISPLFRTPSWFVAVWSSGTSLPLSCNLDTVRTTQMSKANLGLSTCLPMSWSRIIFTVSYYGCPRLWCVQRRLSWLNISVFFST